METKGTTNLFSTEGEGDVKQKPVLTAAETMAQNRVVTRLQAIYTEAIEADMKGNTDLHFIKARGEGEDDKKLFEVVELDAKDERRIYLERPTLDNSVGSDDTYMNIAIKSLQTSEFDNYMVRGGVLYKQTKTVSGEQTSNTQPIKEAESGQLYDTLDSAEVQAL